MKKLHITPGKLQGTVTVPPSKSQTLRALLFAALGSGTSTIENPLRSRDSDSMIQALRHLGARIQFEGDTSIKVTGIGGKVEGSQDVVNAGNSGIVARFITAVAALGSQIIVVTGDASLRYIRPMQPLLDGLKQLGVYASSTKQDGFAPVVIKGPLQGVKAVVQGSDSQPISGLLIAGAFSPQSVEIQVINPGELPWISMTLDWFDRLGISYVNHQFTRYVLPKKAEYEGFTYSVPGDYSSAAFPIAASLITESPITLNNLAQDDIQGDKNLLKHLATMGANVSWEGNSLKVNKGELHGARVDLSDCIDAITTMAVVGCFATGKTTITNVADARFKECNRLQCIAHELVKMGAVIEETTDGLVIQQSSLKGTNVVAHEDHRMAMALTVAALGAEGTTTISGTECIAKTYPHFVRDLSSLGAKIEEVDE